MLVNRKTNPLSSGPLPRRRIGGKIQKEYWTRNEWTRVPERQAKFKITRAHPKTLRAKAKSLCLLPGKDQDHWLQGRIYFASLSHWAGQDQVPSQNRYLCQAPAPVGRSRQACSASSSAPLYCWAHPALLGSGLESDGGSHGVRQRASLRSLPLR